MIPIKRRPGDGILCFGKPVGFQSKESEDGTNSACETQEALLMDCFLLLLTPCS